MLLGCDLDRGTPDKVNHRCTSAKKGTGRYLRTLMVQGAHYILGPFGEDSDLRPWGQKLAERGGKNAEGVGNLPSGRIASGEQCDEYYFLRLGIFFTKLRSNSRSLLLTFARHRQSLFRNRASFPTLPHSSDRFPPLGGRAGGS